VKLVLISRDQRPGKLALDRLQSGATSLGLHLEPELVVSEYAGHAISVARERISDADLLVAVGGDGTLHEVVNGTMSRLNEMESQQIPRIGYVAAGTANDFVRAVGEEGSEAQLLAALAADSWRDIDLGYLSLRGRDGDTREVYFVNVADIGVGAEVVRRIAGSGRRLGATVTYFSPIVRVLAVPAAATARRRVPARPPVSDPVAEPVPVRPITRRAGRKTIHSHGHRQRVRSVHSPARHHEAWRVRPRPGVPALHH